MNPPPILLIRPPIQQRLLDERLHGFGNRAFGQHPQLYNVCCCIFFRIVLEKTDYICLDYSQMVFCTDSFQHFFIQFNYAPDSHPCFCILFHICLPVIKFIKKLFLQKPL